MHQLPESIRESIETIKIPSPPEVLVRLMHAIDDEKSTISDLASIVSQDPGLTYRILAIANSPALSRGTTLKTLDACITSIGTKLMRTLVTCITIQSVFNKQLKLSSTQITEFWSHSLLVAEIARDIAEQIHFPHTHDAYLSGLLHDIGQPILLQVLGEAYRHFLANFEHTPQQISQEFSLFGTTHAEVGAWFLENWGIAPHLVDGVAFHQASPEDIACATELPQIVWLAQALADTQDPATHIEACLPHTAIGLSSQALLRTYTRATEQTQKIAYALGISITPSFPTRSFEADNPFTASAPPALSPAESQLCDITEGLAILSPLQQMLSQLHHMEELTTALKEISFTIFGLSKLFFFIKSQDEEYLTGQYNDEINRLLNEIKIPINKLPSLAARSISDFGIKTSFNKDEKVSLIDIQIIRSIGAEGIIIMPMKTENSCVGVLILGATKKEFEKTKNKNDWMKGFAKIAAIKFENIIQTKKESDRIKENFKRTISQQTQQLIHETGNPLGIIRSYLKILKTKLPDNDLNDEFRILNDEIERVSGIIKGISGDPKKVENHKETNLNATIHELITIYSEYLFTSKNIDLEIKIPKEEIILNIDKDKLKQIFLNIVKNSSEAISNNGCIKISISNTFQNGIEYAKLQIEDNGPGIPTNKVKALFHPEEFTANQQRGLGLSIIGKIAKQEGFLISCQSHPEEGTCIGLLFKKTANEVVFND